MTKRILGCLPHPTDSIRSGRLLTAAFLLWLFYLSSIRVTRLMLAARLAGDPFAALPPHLTFVPIAIGHGVSLCAAWLVLSCGLVGSASAVLKSDWAKARSALPGGVITNKNRYALTIFAFTGVMLWTFVSLAASALPRTSGTTTFQADMNGTIAHHLLVAFLTVITAPLVEELYYRGFLLTQLRLAIGGVPAVLLVSSLFAVQHIGQYRDVTGIISWPSVFAVGVSGLAFTLLRLGTGSLAPSVIAHAIFNGINVGLSVLLLRLHA